MLLLRALCDGAENPTRREGTEKQVFLLGCPQNYGRTMELYYIYLRCYCPLYRIKGANAAFEQATKIDAFLNFMVFS